MPTPPRPVDALDGLEFDAARGRALDAAIEHASGRLRARAHLRGAALKSAIATARVRLGAAILTLSDARVHPQAAAELLDLCVHALVVDYRNRSPSIRRSRGRPTTSRGVLASGWVYLLELEHPERLKLLAELCRDLGDDLPRPKLALALRREINAAELRGRRRVQHEFGMRLPLPAATVLHRTAKEFAESQALDRARRRARADEDLRRTGPPETT